MNTNKVNATRASLLATVLISAFAIPTLANGQGFYGTAMLGGSEQASDSEPYGTNLAVDSTFPNDFDSGEGGYRGLGVGYVFNKRFRVEGRLAMRRGEFDDVQPGAGDRAGQEFVLNGELESKSLTIDGFYDFPTSSRFSPYLKAGLGASRNTYSARLGGSGVQGFFDQLDGTADGYYDDYADQTSDEFSWNIGFGGSVPVSQRLTFFAEYQYVSLGDVKTGQDDFTDGFKIDDAAAHEVLFGIRGNF